ncbi:hypothetical protein FHS95_001408 [Sphingomonas naasensis]|uniref:DUF3828 domain-containing protein n=1 Tax=Sphingomonas naasensis TaxID=1344951 RepID=A0A4S1WES4_9SPHN|nr:hypothetical protein [Sphingomonas naasensis]NIJ19739.1 hypothetical protein [Sphingomonas naasensis]TGX40117.1 hypothetical protein E5A74_16250 [Sphingomonas naasensis]
MILGLVAALAAAHAAPQAKPDEAAIRGMVRAAYATYANPDATPGPELRQTARLDATRKQCAAMQTKIDAVDGDGSSLGECSEEYDMLCQCQDTGDVNWAKIGVAVRFPAADRAEAVLTFKRGGSPNLKLVFARTTTGWVVDDYWEYGIGADGGEASYRKRLTSYIGKARSRLKLAPWTPPAL